MEGLDGKNPGKKGIYLEIIHFYFRNFLLSYPICAKRLRKTHTREDTSIAIMVPVAVHQR